MKLRRRRWSVAACLAIAALALCAWRLWPEEVPARYPRALYERVRIGMPVSDVLAVLGAPTEEALDGIGSDYDYVTHQLEAPSIPMGGQRLVWKCDRHVIFVYAPEGRVFAKYFWERHELRHELQRLLRSVRDSLGL